VASSLRAPLDGCKLIVALLQHRFLSMTNLSRRLTLSEPALFSPRL
jgi:hypothetical protein